MRWYILLFYFISSVRGGTHHGGFPRCIIRYKLSDTTVGMLCVTAGYTYHSPQHHSREWCYCGARIMLHLFSYHREFFRQSYDNLFYDHGLDFV